MGGRSFDDKVAVATAVWAAAGYALYRTWPLSSRSALLAWVAVPMAFQWALAWVLWQRGLPWAMLEGLGRVLYVLVFIILWVFTPLLGWARDWHRVAGPLGLAILSLVYLALAELAVSRFVGGRARQERVQQQEKWRVLHGVPFLDVLFVRLPHP